MTFIDRFAFGLTVLTAMFLIAHIVSYAHGLAF